MQFTKLGKWNRKHNKNAIHLKQIIIYFPVRKKNLKKTEAIHPHCQYSINGEEMLAINILRESLSPAHIFVTMFHDYLFA